MIDAPRQGGPSVHPERRREKSGVGAESGEAGLCPVAVEFARHASPERRRCTQRGRAGGASELRAAVCGPETGCWGGVTGGLPPVPRHNSGEMPPAQALSNAAFVRAGGYGGRHAPAMRPNCDVSRLGPTCHRHHCNSLVSDVRFFAVWYWTFQLNFTCQKYWRLWATTYGKVRGPCEARDCARRTAERVER